MASPKRRLAANVDGDFYVDDTCIDCDTCRWMAPTTFDEVGDQSRVHRQPATPDETRRALLALIACPTGSIGTLSKHDIAAAKAALPDPIDRNVYHCGYHAESSFGAASYLIVRPTGNVLVDSPRWAGSLVKRLEQLGGVRWMFLTHQDDVADHRKFRDHFGCDRVMHRDDARHGTRDVEVQIDGAQVVSLEGEQGASAPVTDAGNDLRVIPTPGHTRGSACLLAGGRYLFTGDHLAYSERRGHLYAFRTACWYDWSAQIRSMERLVALQREHPFQWVLPGHGRRWHGSAPQMAAQLEQCVAWMRRH